VNLGGIGAGKIEFCPSGRFSNVTVQNNWDVPICGTAAEFRPAYEREGIPGAFLAAWVHGAGARVLKEKARPGLKGLSPGDARYEGKFPRAVVGYPRMNGVELSVEAFSSLTFDSGGRDHYKDSSLPAAAFVFRLANRTREARRASVLMSWQNLVGMGGYVSAQVNDGRSRRVTHRKSGRRHGLVFDCTEERMNPRVDGNYTLMTEEAAGRKVTWLAGYRPVDTQGWDLDVRLLWDSFRRDGRLPNEETGSPPFFDTGISGALAVSVRLAPGESTEIPFVLGWFFPNLLAGRKRSVNYGHAYENWFGCSWEAAEYVLAERVRLYAGTRAWQRALEDSNLPGWLVEKLQNDLFSLYACSWYTKDFRHTVNESPTDMGGCAGTIDQRAASSGVYDMCYPRLSRSELTLFGVQQVGARHPERRGLHWDARKGRFGRRLDRRGAIRHDVGWDDLEGGQFGSPVWQNLHWPDLSSVFVLESWRYVLWTGDRKFLAWVYSRVKEALDFQARLDQNGDGVADLWGHGSSTYDAAELHYYGASSFVASLWLAANIAAAEMAEVIGDRGFARVSRRRLAKARKTYEEVLWDAKHRRFLSWHDTNWRAWKGTDREHRSSGTSSMVAQAAGQWFSNLLGMADIADRGKIAGALEAIYRRNVSLPKYCAATDVEEDGAFNASWPPYVETYYAANAIYEGRPDEGLEAVKKIYLAQYRRDGSPWDTPLKWSGKENDEFGWGRWYMTNPASWFLLGAITGAGVDMVRGVLTLSPSIPKEIGGGKKLKGVPVFFPKFQGKVYCESAKGRRRIRLIITRLVGGKPVRFVKLRVAATGRVPKVKLNGKAVTVKPAGEEGRYALLEARVTFAAEGDVLEVTG